MKPFLTNSPHTSGSIMAGGHYGGLLGGHGHHHTIHHTPLKNRKRLVVPKEKKSHRRVIEKKIGTKLSFNYRVYSAMPFFSISRKRQKKESIQNCSLFKKIFETYASTFPYCCIKEEHIRCYST